MSKILLIDPISPALFAGVRALLPPNLDVDLVPTRDEADLTRMAADAEVLLVIDRPIDARVLALAPKVRFIQRFGAGYDNIDLAAARDRGLKVSNTPGANAIPVAEHAIMLMLALLKRLPMAEQATRGGRWPPMELMQIGLGDLQGATVGLVGLGATGQAVAERLAVFGAQLLYTGRKPVDAATEARLQVAYRPFADLLTASEIVSLHLPLSEETRELIGAAQLAQMRRGALLINTSRGGLIDEAALHAAIVSGQIGGAALDVLQNEAPDGNPFTDLSQVIVTPHIAGVSRAATRHVVQQGMMNVVRFLKGEEPHDLVSLA